MFTAALRFASICLISLQGLPQTHDTAINCRRSVYCAIVLRRVRHTVNTVCIVILPMIIQ